MVNLEYLCIGDEVALLVVAEDPAFPNVGYMSVQVTPIKPLYLTSFYTVFRL